MLKTSERRKIDKKKIFPEKVRPKKIFCTRVVGKFCEIVVASYTKFPCDFFIGCRVKFTSKKYMYKQLFYYYYFILNN